MTDPSTCIISLVRIFTLHKGIHTTDPFWDNAPAAYWSVVELNCGILCACFPTLRPLLKKVVPQLHSTYNSSGEPAPDTPLDSLRKQKSRDPDLLDLDTVYIQEDFEFHSTTELRETTNDDRASEDMITHRLDIESKVWAGDKSLDISHT